MKDIPPKMSTIRSTEIFEKNNVCSFTGHTHVLQDQVRTYRYLYQVPYRSNKYEVRGTDRRASQQTPLLAAFVRRIPSSVQCGVIS